MHQHDWSLDESDGIIRCWTCKIRKQQSVPQRRPPKQHDPRIEWLIDEVIERLDPLLGPDMSISTTDQLEYVEITIEVDYPKRRFG